jgi:hypothetical protein
VDVFKGIIPNLTAYKTINSEDMGQLSFSHHVPKCHLKYMFTAQTPIPHPRDLVGLER